MFCALRNVCSTVVHLTTRPQLSQLTITITRQYAEVKKSGKGGGSAVGKKKDFPVETDPFKLVEYVCGSNIYKEGGEDVKLKPESEYPEWLWSIRTGPPPRLHELDPTSKEYWQKVRVLARRKNNRMHRLKCKVLKQF